MSFLRDVRCIHIEFQPSNLNSQQFFAAERCNFAPQDGTAGPAEVTLNINKSRLYTLKIEPKLPFPRCDGNDLSQGVNNEAGNVSLMLQAMCAQDTCSGKDNGCSK
jgi:hypothetical protein